MKLYDKDHKLAKLIVTVSVILCLCLARVYGIFIFDIIGVIVWIWGVNPIAYWIEKVQNHRHKHPKL